MDADEKTPGMNPRVQLMYESLSGRWPVVRALDREDCAILLDRFCASFIRPDLYRRFRESFGASGITPRFFNERPAGLSLQNDVLATVRAQRPETVAADVVWGVWGSPHGLRVEGPPRPFADELVDEGDAVLRVTVGPLERWFFLPDDDDELWAMQDRRPHERRA
jgi:hypothetical protein